LIEHGAGKPVVGEIGGMTERLECREECV